MKQLTFLIKEDDSIADRMFEVGEMIQRGLKAGPVKVILTREGRTEPQNDHLHPVIREIAKYMEEAGAPKRSETWWRYYFLGKWEGQEMLPDPMVYLHGKMDGTENFIVMNRKGGTSGLTKGEASDFLEFLYSFSAEIGCAG